MRTILMIFVVLCAANGFSEESNPADGTVSMPENGVCAHRGANSLAPENTVPAFEEAVRRGAEMVELDTKYTKDGKIVILHDGTIDRTSDGTGRPSDYTFEEIRRFDFGSWKDPKFAGTRIPTLDEVFAVLPQNVWVNLHTPNNPKLALEVADWVVAHGRQHQSFLATGKQAMDAVRQKYPDFYICNMDRQGGDNAAYTANTIAWKCDFIQFTTPAAPEQTAALHAAGVRINYFYCNDLKKFEALRESGVDFPLVDNMPAVGR